MCFVGEKNCTEESRGISDYLRQVREKYEKEKKNSFYDQVQPFDGGF